MKKKSKKKKSFFQRTFFVFLKRATIFLLICSAAIAFILYSPFFVLNHVDLYGAKYLKVEDIMKISNLYIGEPLFQLETDAVTKRLMGDLRIENVQVVRDLPDRLSVTITERVPIATVVSDYGYFDIDRNCKIIDIYKDLKAMPIPMITGLAVHDLFIGDDLNDEMTKKIVEFLQYLDEQTTSEISEIAIIDENYVVAYTVRKIQIRIGQLERLEEKARYTEDFLRDLSQNPHNVEYIDLDYTSPYIKVYD